MNTNRNLSIILAVIAALALFASCKMGFENSPNAGTVSNTNARVTLSLPQRSRNHDTQTTGARAIGIFIDRVKLTAINDSNAVVASATVDLADAGVDQEIGLNVPSGIRIRIKADVFNLAMSGETPMVSGTSIPITVTTDATVAVTITCVPTSPILVGTEPQELSIGTDVKSSVTGMEYTSTDEKWLKVVGGKAPYIMVSFDMGGPLKQDPNSSLNLGYEVFNASGARVDSRIAQPYSTGYQISIEAQEGEEFYICTYFFMETRDQTITGAIETLCSVSTGRPDLSADEMEPNDSKGAAAPIVAGETYDLTLLDDDDWFRLDIDADCHLYLNCFYEETWLHPDLLKPDGSTIHNFMDGIVKPGTYYIHVNSVFGPCSYSLSCTLGPLAEDNFGNNTYVTARDLQAVDATDIYILGDTADWFYADLDAPSGFKMTPTFINPNSDERYSVTLYDSALNVLSGPNTYGTTWSPTQGASEALLAGKYYVKIQATVGHPVYWVSSTMDPIGTKYVDYLDPNESVATAKPIGNCGSMSNTSTDPQYLADDDWYSYKSGAANNLMVNFNVVPAMTLEVTICDDGTYTLYNEALSQWKNIQYNFIAGKKYYILVRPLWKEGEGIINDVPRYTLSLY